MMMRLKIILFSCVMITSHSSLRAQDEVQAQRDACAKNTAMQWDGELNRCVGKAQARQERHEAQDCHLLTDEAARKACHMGLATKKTGLTDDPEKAGSKVTSLQSRSMMINTANSIVAGINYFAKDKVANSCMSKTIFGVTALGGFVTDLMLKSSTKKKLNSMKDKFVVDAADSAYNAQVKALEYLKEEQKVVKDVAGKEKKRQMLLMVGYGAAVATAAYETFYNPGCYGDDGAKKDGKTDGKTAESKPEAKPATDGAKPEVKGDASAISSVTGQLGTLFGSPTGVMILGGIGGINAMTLYSAAGDQEKESEANIKKVDTILASFKDSFANFCPNGREKLEEPSCYCYLADGKQNTTRTNSQICQQLWAKNKYIYDTTKGLYAGTGVVDPVGCVNINKEFDENCTCKKMLNSQNQNACLKGVNLNTVGGLGSAYTQGSGLNLVSDNLNSTALGSSNIGTLTPTQIGSAIGKQKELNKQVLAKLPKKNVVPSNAALEKYSKAIFTKKALDALGAMSGGSTLASAAGSSASGSPAVEKALAEAKKTAGISLDGGNGLGKAKDEKKAGMDFNFMDAPAGGGQGGQVVGNFPEKSYKYKDSDIVTDKGASIFEIISNRYVESGLRRLFEVPEETVK